MQRHLHFFVTLAVLTLLLVCSRAQAVPRLDPVKASERSEAQAGLAVRFEPLGMQNLVATLLRYPELARAVLPYSEYLLSGSSLPAHDRELVSLRTAWLARSSYVWAHRAARARAIGLTAAELERVAIGPQASGWSPFEAALLRAADELHVDAFVTAATWQTLAARYEERQLIDLLYGAGEVAMLSDFANTLRVEIESSIGDRFPAGITYTVAAAWRQPRLLGAAPRIAPLEPAQWSAEVRQLLDPTGAGRPVANVFRTFARNPPVDALRNAVGAHIRGATSLTPKHRQMLIMRTAVVSDSEYEWAVHSRVGRQVGLTDAEVAGVFAGPGTANGAPVETTLLRAADDLLRDNTLSEETWDALRTQFNERQLFDVLVTVGGYRSGAYAISSAGVQFDDGMVGFPK